VAKQEDWKRRIQDTQLQMRASAEFLKSIDDWRDKQPDSPPRAEAVRRLVELGLAAAAPAPRKPKKEKP